MSTPAAADRDTPTARERPAPAGGRRPRIVGLDLARTIAILGMVGAHVASIGPKESLPAWDRPETWQALAHGRPSLLFALLAGVSMALVSGGRRPPTDPDELRRLRLRLVGRGVAVFAVGTAADVLGTPVAVVLGLYGVLFVLAPLFITWSTTRLLATAAALALLAPPAVSLLHSASLHAGGSTTGLVLGYFPLTVWLVPVLVGLALGRLDLTRRPVLVGALVSGLAALVVGEVVGRLLRGDTRAADGVDLPGSFGYLERLRAQAPLRRAVDDWTSLIPHSGGTPEQLTGLGTALLVLALCVLLTERLGAHRRLLAPVTALGTMPLTGYLAHLVVMVVVMGGPRGDWPRSDALWLGLSLGLLAAAWAWSHAFGSGPLERWVGRVAERFAR